MSASLFGLSETQALVVLFVLAPFLVAALIVPIVIWLNSGSPPPVRTSDILAGGLAGEAEVRSVRVGGSIFDVRPMVRFDLRVTSIGGDSAEPFDLEVVQSLPRRIALAYRPGDRVEVRITPDRSAGALVWDRPA